MGKIFVPISMLQSPGKHILIGIWVLLGLLMVLAASNIWDNAIFAAKAVGTDAAITELGPSYSETYTVGSTTKSTGFKRSRLVRKVTMVYKDATGREHVHEKVMAGARNFGDKIPLHYHRDRPSEILHFHDDESWLGLIIVVMLAFGAWALFSKVFGPMKQPDPVISQVASRDEMLALRHHMNQMHKPAARMSDEDFREFSDLIDAGDGYEAIEMLVQRDGVTQAEAERVVESFELKLAEVHRRLKKKLQG